MTFNGMEYFSSIFYTLKDRLFLRRSLLSCFQLVCKEKVVLPIAPEVKSRNGTGNKDGVIIIRTYALFVRSASTSCSNARHSVRLQLRDVIREN